MTNASLNGQRKQPCQRFSCHWGSQIKRLICPAGIQVPISELASRHIENSDLHSVTMEDKGRFRIYNYEEPISNIENARVLLSWEHSLSHEKKPFCLLLTDINLDVVTILEYYSIRWEFEFYIDDEILKVLQHVASNKGISIEDAAKKVLEMYAKRYASMEKGKTLAIERAMKRYELNKRIPRH